MKKYITTIIFLATCIAAAAADIPQGTPLVRYSLPMTMVTAHVKYERVEQQPGIFYQYAERYLGNVNVITENNVQYRLVSVDIKAKAVADSAKTYTLNIEKVLPNIVLNKKGIIFAIGSSCPPLPAPQKRETDNAQAKKHEPLLPPLTEEQLRAGSMAKMAESTAKLIYRLREERVNLIAGETEVADGEALKTMLRKLENTEKQLTDLFTGTTSVTCLNAEVPCNIEQDIKHSILFRFSKYSGVTQPEDLAGEAVFIDVTAQKVNATTPDKTPKIGEAIYYNIPGSATISVYTVDQKLVTKTVNAAQHGPAVPLPLNTIKDGKTITYDVNTGAIISIQ
ncbi:MAG TPA: hypothetical protein DEO38_04260 [Bacteroidales bacterium]|nr:hypothetical protein [Bacteroidales bacterium]